MKTTVIYHSADYDGIFCREIAKKFLPDAELIGWDYKDEKIPFPDGTVYVLDLSPECFSDWLTAPDGQNRLIWIDHHKTAIEKFEVQHKFGAGYRIDGVAACRLTWQFFANTPPIDVLQKDWLPSKQQFIDRQVVEPEGVRLAGEYDIWDKRDPRAEVFQFGLRSRELTPHDWSMLLAEERDCNMHIVSTLLKDGQLLQRYQQDTDASIVKYRSFEIEWEGLRFLALNTARCNSLTFAAAVKPEHDGLLGFCWNGKKWTVSLYGATKPEIDLSAIAVKYGGGGHKQACGFTCEKLPFLS